MIRVEKVDNQFQFKLTYQIFQNNQEIKKFLRWNPSQKVWYTENVARFIQAYELLKGKGEPVQIDEHSEKILLLKELATATESKSKNIVLNTQIREYQKVAVEYLLTARKAILADEMGLGKTCEVISALNVLASTGDEIRVVIVCPAHLKNVWVMEFRKFSEVFTSISVVNRTKENTFLINTNKPGKISVIILNYDIFEKYLVNLELHRPHVVVFDESHYLKNLSAKRTKTAIRFVSNTKPPYVWLLTGTPLTKDAMDLFPQLKILGHPLAENYMYFAKRYADMREEMIMGRWVKKFGISNAKELREILLATCLIQRKKSQVLHELPEKIRQMIILDPSEVQSLIDQEKEVLRATVANPDDSEEVENTLEHPEKLPKLNMLAQIRQQLALKKLPVIVNFVDDIICSNSEEQENPENQKKVVIFAHHLSVITELVNALKKIYSENSVARLTGMETQRDKQIIIDWFQNHENPRILVCSITAVATGITLTRASTCVFAELDWIPANIMQAEDRLHRIGQKNSVNIYYVVFENSLESYIAKKMLKRKTKIEKLI